MPLVVELTALRLLIGVLRPSRRREDCVKGEARAAMGSAPLLSVGIPNQIWEQDALSWIGRHVLRSEASALSRAWHALADVRA